MAVWRFTRPRFINRPIAGHACAPCLWRINFQAAAYQLGPVVHDMKTEALLWVEIFRKSDPVINHTQHHFLADSLQPHHALARLSVAIAVYNRCGSTSV